MQGDELGSTKERLKESESRLEICQQGCAEKEEELKKRNGRIEHLSSEISRMNRFDNDPKYFLKYDESEMNKKKAS